MRTSILISKICRAVETGGATNDGAKLAGLYADAVNAANARLDAVVAAVESRQFSDAMRIMEDEPRLMDEVSALDFMRLPDWEVICGRNGWTTPPKIDRSQLERVMIESEGAAAGEAYMKMYRKAVRMKDTRLAVVSLRHLAKTDPSKGWGENLAAAEAELQGQIGQSFGKAIDSGDDAEAERIAREFLAESWSRPPEGRVAAAMRKFVDAADAKVRDREGAENIEILRKCRDEEWNLELASSILGAIDRLVEGGWAVPKVANALVDGCRRRCEEEFEEQARDAEWREHCGTLHSAVQMEAAQDVREALSWPGFNDREPPEDLLRDAMLVLEHEEARRRRKTMQASVCVVLGIGAVLGVSTWILKLKVFNDRCRSEAQKLEALANAANPIEQLKAELTRLERDEPKVFADGRIGAYTGKLGTLVAENAARTNELVSLLVELERLMADEWRNSTATVTGKIERAKVLVKSHDADYDRRLREIRKSYLDFQDATDTANRALAGIFSESLFAKSQEVTEMLKKKFLRPQQEAEVEKLKEMFAKWKDKYASNAPEPDVKVRESEAAFTEAENSQKNLRNAIAKLKDAHDAKEIAEACAVLMSHYGDYDVIAHLKPLEYGLEDVSSAIEGTEVKAFADRLKNGISEDDFKAFLDDQVLALSTIPSYYSLYGIYAQCWQKKSTSPVLALIALSRGKPTISDGASYKSIKVISGDLIDLTPDNFGKA